MNLESGLVDFLKAEEKLSYDIENAEPGFVGLCKFSELKEDKVWLEGPKPGNTYYEIPAINLTCENEHYDPEFILCWLPNEKCYGSWDSDHWILYTFNDVTWSEIVKNPLPFINCQWYQEQEVGKIFNPVGKYKVIEGWPF